MNAAVKAALEAAKKDTVKAQKPDRLYLEATPENIEVCQAFLTAKSAKDDAERLYKEEVLNVRKITDPAREEKCFNGEHCTTVEIPMPDGGAVQMQYKSVFTKFDESRKADLTEITGEEAFNKLFTEKKTLSVKKNVLEDESKTTDLITRLLSVLSPAEFGQYFEFTTEIVAKPNFDTLRFSLLAKEKHEQLATIGLKQTVAPYAR